MKLISQNDCVLVTATLTYGRNRIEIPDVLIDTGASHTVINADVAGEVGIYAHTGELRKLRGVGGTEHVFRRHVDRFAIGARGIDNLALDFGAMDYGIELGGILGMDFLMPTRSVIDLAKLEITFGDAA